jgi:ubiquinone biosynthesis protein
MDIKTISRLNRFREIVLILVKYGFADLVERFDLPGMGALEKVTGVDEELGTYERIRLMLEELGPTFVKFGQIMSLRPDLVPKGLIVELSKLQDEVPPVPYEVIREEFEASLGRPTEEVFRIFDPEPIAAASLSQVHAPFSGKRAGWWP